MKDEFYAWFDKNRRDMDHVFELLSDQLRDEPEALIGDLEAVEAWFARIDFLLAECNSYLDKSLSLFLPPKSNDKSEMDRKAVLDAEVAPIREIRDKLEGLSNAIKHRISLGQSILKYKSQSSDFTPTTEKRPSGKWSFE